MMKRKKPAIELSGGEIRRELDRKYPSMGRGGRRMGRKEYISEFQDVVSESSLGNSKKVQRVAARKAGKAWDGMYGPKGKKKK